MTTALLAALTVTHVLFVFAWSIDRIGVLRDQQHRTGTRVAAGVAAMVTGGLIAFGVLALILGQGAHVPR